MLLAAAGTLALGLTLLVLGLRGRRIDDHPVCRKCKFDLIGLTPPQPNRDREGADTPAPPRCPECGADLSHPRATRTGARRRRPLAIVLGLILALAGLGVGGALGWGLAAKYDWNKSKPAWLLLREADSRKPDQPVLRELWRRLRAHRLADPQARQLVDRALAVQADPSITWDYHWGLIIESGRDQSLVDDTRWAAFANNARGTLAPANANPFSRHAAALYFQPQMNIGEGRGGLSMTLRRIHRLDRLIIGEHDLAIAPDWEGNAGAAPFQLGVSGGFSWTFIRVPDCRGQVTVESFWTVSIIDDSSGGPPRTLAQWQEHFTRTWNIDEAPTYPQPLAERRTPPELQSADDWVQALTTVPIKPAAKPRSPSVKPPAPTAPTPSPKR